MRPLRVLFVAISLAIALRVPARAAGPPAPKPATSDEIERLVHDLTTARDVSVQHVVSRVEHVRFFSKKPCARLVEVAEFTAQPGADWAATFANTLELARLDSLARLPLRLCWTDTTREDHFHIALGSGAHVTEAYPNFGDLACRWVHGSMFLCTPLEPHVAALRTLLRQALPHDTLLDDVPACIPRPDSLFDADEPPAFGATGFPPDELPEPVYRSHAVYPELARRSQIEGTVTIEALVSREGLVTRTVIVKSIAELDEEAVRAVEQWTFKPARSRGQPVAVWVGVPVDFRLH